LTQIKIPKERVGALIGKKGEAKKWIEQRTGVKMLVDSSEGDIELDTSQLADPSMALVIPNIVKAIGRGFSPEHAFELLDDDTVLEILDIRDYVGKKPNHVSRVRARLIGTNGKTRRIMEDLTDTHISVFGNTVAVIGGSIQASITIRAIEMIIEGAEHATVYRFLEGKRDVVRAAGMGFD
jgi:ribosomal RNA assembly protein